VRLAHVRERHAPAGTDWRLAAALDIDGRRWLDLEVARWRAVRADPTLEHDSVLHRRPVTTLDDHLARGLRVAALAGLVDGFEPRDVDDDAVLRGEDLRFGPPVLRPPSIRDGYGFEGHVATMWRRRDQDVPEAWYRLPVFYFSNPAGVRGPDDPVWAPRGSAELDYELEVAALIDTPVTDLTPSSAVEAIGGYTIFDDFSARDLQRDETTVRLCPRYLPPVHRRRRGLVIRLATRDRPRDPTPRRGRPADRRPRDGPPADHRHGRLGRVHAAAS
jgi:hypothetical protein